MAPNNPERARFSLGQRSLHWLVFLCVLLAYVFVNIKGWLPHGDSTRAQMMEGHFAAGLAVLLLIGPRLLLRLRRGVPPVSPQPPRLLHVLGHITHGLLYVFLIVQPLLGLAAVELGGHPVDLPFGLAIPAFFGAGDPGLGHAIREIHEDLGDIFYWVIGLHIVAALWHHSFRRDDTLRRML